MNIIENFIVGVIDRHVNLFYIVASGLAVFTIFIITQSKIIYYGILILLLSIFLLKIYIIK